MTIARVVCNPDSSIMPVPCLADATGYPGRLCCHLEHERAGLCEWSRPRATVVPLPCCRASGTGNGLPAGLSGDVFLLRPPMKFAAKTLIIAANVCADLRV